MDLKKELKKDWMNGMPNDRNNLIEELNDYSSASAEEQKFIPQFLELLKSDRCFYRDHFDDGHVTGSALLLNQIGDKILMNYHKSLNRWLCFGGHCDGDEDVFNVAIRETMEESGLTVFKPLSPNFIDLDIHEIPANPKREEPKHFHYDVRYVMQMTDEQTHMISDESVALKWVGFDEALNLIDKDDSLHRAIHKIR
jgi:8-oxo-dGTP pyrophosphatase MutT (NUDIX family)